MPVSQVSIDEWDAVRASHDYRAFLRAYLEKRSMSFSDLARAAGFGRGFPSDVISGRRRLTAKSYLAFEAALKLPPQGRKLFRFLVAQDERDLFPELDGEVIRKAIEELRRKPWCRVRREIRPTEIPKLGEVMKDSDALAIYAAAGRPGKGSSFSEIRQRASLPDSRIEARLIDLERVGLIRYSEGLYEPVDLHTFFKADDHDDLVVAVFQQACQLASERATQALASERDLFFNSAFCVDEARLPELKAALRSTVLKFVDEAIEPEGNRVVRLVTALHL